MGTAGPDLDLAVEVQQCPPRSGVFPNILGNLPDQAFFPRFGVFT